MNVDWKKPWPFGVVLFGSLILLLAVIGTFTGKTYGMGGGTYRAKKRFEYWTMLVIQYISGVVLIWCGLAISH